MKFFFRNTIFMIVSLFSIGPSLAADTERVQVKLDTGEAEQVLAILAKRKQAQPIMDADWDALFCHRALSTSQSA
jgi:hypothetical protein